MAQDIFISYSHHDQSVANSVCQGLESAGFRCWIAPRDIPYGAEWGAAIISAIEQSRVLILIFSENANASAQVAREVERATTKGRVVIPVRIADVKPAQSLEYFIGNLQWLEAITPPFNEHLDRLADALAALTKAKRSPRESTPTGGHASETAERNLSTSPRSMLADAHERRQVTALNVSIVNADLISERLGDEGSYTLFQPLYKLMGDAIDEQGGTSIEVRADGMLALFGVPDALENGPLRACRAGLAILERVAVWNIKAAHDVTVLIGIGIDTGMAVITRIGDANGPTTALGDAINLASHLAHLASPGEVLLGDPTFRLVQGLVDFEFRGEREIDGRSDRQRVYRLDRIRPGTARFDAAVSRGLTTYIGRDRELELLGHAMTEARSGLRVVDIVADPGMGKSRLLYEFGQQIRGQNVFVLTGRCSADGQQTPFLPFIEVIRGSFRVDAGEADKDVISKLETGLKVLGMNAVENLALLLNLLGLKVPEGALAELDGVLIGLRTRDILQELLKMRCRLSPVVMSIEDLHWIDGASEELLDKLVQSRELRLLILHTRRREYIPGWLRQPIVENLHLDRLPAADILRLANARLGISSLPDALARQLIEKAEGNPLFAEEIVSFLIERGSLRTMDGKLEFDDTAIATLIPSSVQDLLIARVDRLDPIDREVLQVASVIGRSFDTDLLRSIALKPDLVDAQLRKATQLGLVYPDGRTGGFIFKHVLMRDALYQNLLINTRSELHLKIAEEIERRSGNRLGEVADALAHHYRQTNRPDKAFTYLAMAGTKCLGVYSLDEAEIHFAGAISLLDRNPDIVDGFVLVKFISDYTHFLNLNIKFAELVNTVERYASRLDAAGDSTLSVLINHQLAFALIHMARFRDAKEVQVKLSDMATRLGDARSQAYSLASEIYVTTIVSPKSTEDFEARSKEALEAATRAGDIYIRIISWYVIGWEEFHRGRMIRAKAAATELISLGREFGDPRAINLGLGNMLWIALTSDDYGQAVRYGNEAVSLASTPWDRFGNSNGRAIALALARAPTGFDTLRKWIEEVKASDYKYCLAGADLAWGISLAINGKIRSGIRFLRGAMLVRSEEGYESAAEWYRMFIAEIYLEIFAPTMPVPIGHVIRNLPFVLYVKLTARARIMGLLAHVRANGRLDPNGHHIARTEMIIGLLNKATRKRDLAIEHLTQAHRIAAPLGHTPMLTKIERALAQLQDG